MLTKKPLSILEITDKLKQKEKVNPLLLQRPLTETDFENNQTIVMNLKPTALRTYMTLLTIVSPGIDWVNLSMEELNKSTGCKFKRSSFYSGLNQLKKAGIIAKSGIQDVYFVNSVNLEIANRVSNK